MKSLTERAEEFAREWIKSKEYIEPESGAFPTGKGSPVDCLEHGRQVASVLREWGASLQLQTAGLLHSLVWNYDLSLDSETEIDDEQTAFLCQEYKHILEKQPEGRWQGQSLALEKVKYLMLAYRDRDLALLGAADLWSHYQLAQLGNGAHQEKYRQIAIQVISPYLQFLGMAELRHELQNTLGFATSSEPNAAYQKNGWSEQTLVDLEPVGQEKALGSDEAFDHAKGIVSTNLPNACLYEDTIAGRAREWDSSKRDSQGATEHGLADTPKPESSRQMGLLVERAEDCYQTLYRLHQLFIPEEGAVRDSINRCLSNGYRSLQTTVVHDNVSIHFEICTRQMNEVNRWGLVAAHLRIDAPEQDSQDGDYTKDHAVESETTNSDNALSDAWWNQAEGQHDFIESAPLGALSEVLHVFSTHGKLYQFHRGCTVVDYAYSVHGEKASQCRQFFINGEAVEPATALHHLDLVDLEIDPTAPGPTRVWSSAAVTPLARSAIERYLKRHGEGIHHAQQILDDRLRELEEHYGFRMPEYRVNQGLAQEVKQLQLSSKESLMTEISTGRLSVDRILHPLFASEIIRQVQIPPEMSLRPHQLILAECCRPKPGEEIIGIPQLQDGIIHRLEIHKSGCPEAANSEAVDSADGPADEPTDAPAPLKWSLQQNLRTVAQIELRALDEAKLLADAVNQIYAVAPHVTLHRSAFSTRNGGATAQFVVEASGTEVIDKIADSLRHLPDRTVDEVYQLDLPLSEQDELFQAVSTAQPNPYTRMPVYEEGMFFGRTQELNEIRAWLRARVGIIWLVGQKRVGKTSLLLHLKNHFLDKAEFTPIYLDFQMLHSLEPADIFFEIASSVYAELQNEGYRAELGPPLQTMFEYDPMGNLVRYLRSAQSNPNVGKFVLLLDEFSRTTDAHQSGKLSENFFTQWRGLVQMTQPDIKYIVVVQQQAINRMTKRGENGHEDPSWHLMELGESRKLRPLTEKDARNLIERPIRNYMESTPDLLDRIHTLTGSSPFLIQSFCFKLVSNMVQLNKRRLEWPDLDMVRMEFMSPSESIFAHLLDMIQGSTYSMCILVAKIADEELQRNSRATPLVSWDQIAATYPVFLSNRLRNSLNELCERHILIAVEQHGSVSWRFSSILFQEWLALNAEEE